MVKSLFVYDTKKHLLVYSKCHLVRDSLGLPFTGVSMDYNCCKRFRSSWFLLMHFKLYIKKNYNT